MRALLVAGAIVLTMLATALLLGPAEAAPPLPNNLVGDAQWIERAEELSRLRLPLFVAGLLLGPAALTLFVTQGWSSWLRRRLVESGVHHQWLLVALFTLILHVGAAALYLPLDYAGHLLRVRFGLASESVVEWLWRHGAEVAVAAVPYVIAAEGLYWSIRVFRRWWWLLASAGYVLFSLLFVYLQPLVITPLFFEQWPLTDSALRARILQMGGRTGVPVNEVFVIDWSKQGYEGNAYFTGVGNATRIVIYDTLLASYPHDELATILAHEMGHWRERHVWKSLAMSWIVTPVVLLVTQRLMQASLPRWGIRGAADIAGLPFLLLLSSLFLLATLPIQNWQSRRWEAEADRIALAATEDPDAMARTFVRLARQNLSDPTPPLLQEALFATHPALGRRVASVLEETSRP